MSRKLGNIGEDLACELLEKSGYQILDRNYQIRGGEIDIVATEDEVIVFVEVKYRKDEGYGTVVDAITPRKLQKILRAAKVYLYQNDLFEKDWRIDVVAIDAANEKSEIVKNVFIEGLK